MGKKRVFLAIVIICFAIIMLSNSLFALENYDVYLPFNAESDEKVYICIKLDTDLFDDVTGINMIANEKLIPVESFTKLELDGNRYLKISVSKEVGLVSYNQIQLKSNSKTEVINVEKIALEGLTNINNKLMYPIKGKYTVDSLIITYKNFGAEQVTILSLNSGSENIDIEMYDSQTNQWVSQRSISVKAREEVSYRLNYSFSQEESLQYFVKPLLKFRYQAKDYCQYEMFISNYPANFFN